VGRSGSEVWAQLTRKMKRRMMWMRMVLWRQNSVNETGVAQVNGRHAVTSDTEDERNAADKDFKPVF